MTKYRRDLPQLHGGTYLTDGGLETTLIFQRGIELPHFASFTLLDDPIGREELSNYYETYLAIASNRKLGFVLDTATWRANPDWGMKLGYDLEALRALNRRSVEQLAQLRTKWERPGQPIILSGAIGPRGDGYRQGVMSAVEAEAYHAFQVRAFAETDADMVTAFTMNNPDEAIGIARAARKAEIPCVISFTVETDGRLASGASLREAVERTDAECDTSPIYYMINCAHPTHFASALERGEDWVRRIGGIRANASTKSHEELDNSTELDSGNPDDLGLHYHQLRTVYPTMRILGGCCGTSHQHVLAICDACLPQVAAE